MRYPTALRGEQAGGTYDKTLGERRAGKKKVLGGGVPCFQGERHWQMWGPRGWADEERKAEWVMETGARLSKPLCLQAPKKG